MLVFFYIIGHRSFSFVKTNFQNSSLIVLNWTIEEGLYEYPGAAVGHAINASMFAKLRSMRYTVNVAVSTRHAAELKR